MKTKYQYSVSTTDQILADDLETREDARSVLRSLKAQGHTDAKIYQSEFVHILTKQVR